MSGDPAIAVLLVGLEIDEISTSPVGLPKVKQAIRSVRFTDAQRIANRSLQFDTGEEVREYVKSELRILCKGLIED